MWIATVSRWWYKKKRKIGQSDINNFLARKSSKIAFGFLATKSQKRMLAEDHFEMKKY